MNALKKIKKLGFTLIELMVVVAILSVLATVAIPSFQKYLQKSKTTEAYANLRKLYDGQMTYFQQEIVDGSGKVLPKRFMQTSIEPPWPPGVQKRVGNFDSPEWSLLQFAADSPLQYVYFTDAFPFVDPYPFRPPDFDVTADPPTDIVVGMLVNVIGDTDGDGKFSHFERSAGVSPDGKMNVKGGIYALDPLE